MTDARGIFHDLQDLAGGGFDSTEFAAGPDLVERRVARWRGARTALMSVASVAVIAAVAVGVNESRSAAPLPAGPIETPVTASASPAPEASATTGTTPAGCAPAQVVSGKSVGNLGGLEGWFNGTPSAPCEEWEQRILDHPDTVLIYTEDNTMVEAYYRTSIDALGVYTDLGPDFVVPDPDPEWPARSLVLIDARTGELLQTTLVSNYSADELGVPEPGTTLDSNLLSNWEALAVRLRALPQSGMVPDGFEFSAAVSDGGAADDLVPLVIYERTSPASSDFRQPSAPSNLTVRLLPRDSDELVPPDATVLDRDIVGERSVLFEPPFSDSLQLSIPIGDDALLMLVGNADAADGFVMVPFARQLLAE